MDFSQFKSLIIGGVELKQLSINGVQVWNAEAASYTNQIPISTDASGAIYNGKGWKEHTWVNGGNENYNWGTYVTGFIPCKVGDIIRLKDVTFNNSTAYGRLSFFNSNKTYIGQVLSNGTWNLDTEFKGVKDASGNYTQLTIKSLSGVSANCAFIRITAQGLTDASIITINEEIK